MGHQQINFKFSLGVRVVLSAVNSADDVVSVDIPIARVRIPARGEQQFVFAYLRN